MNGYTGTGSRAGMADMFGPMPPSPPVMGKPGYSLAPASVAANVYLAFNIRKFCISSHVHVHVIKSLYGRDIYGLLNELSTRLVCHK